MPHLRRINIGPVLRMSAFAVATVLSLGCHGAVGPQEGEHKAIVNANVVPMDRDIVLENHTVLIRGDVIVAVGPNTSVNIPGDAVRIDGTGKYLMPGLADLHVHLRNEVDLPGYVAHGVTTLLDMGAPAFVLGWRDRIERRELFGPHLLVSYFIDGPGGRISVETTTESARAAIERAAANGYDYIKVYNSLTAGQFDAIMAEARRHEIAVIGHGVRAPGMQGILEAGQAMIAHGEEYIYTFFQHTTDRSRIPDAVAITRAAGAYVLPNLSAYEIITLQLGKPAVVDSFLSLPDAKYLPPSLRESWRAGRYTGATGDLRPRLAFLKDLTRAFVDGGVPILLGTDSPTIPGMFPGASIHNDLRNLVDAGLTPYQALEAGTRNAGEFVRGTVADIPVFGVVAEGARADLVLLQSNPLNDIEAVMEPVGVMLHGAWWSADALHQILEDLF